MADNQDIGKYARHPIRTAGGALLVGTAIGASLMAAKKQREKNFFQKLVERLDEL